MSAISGSPVLKSARILRHDRMSAVMEISRRRKDFLGRELLVELAINLLIERANIIGLYRSCPRERRNGIRAPQRYPLSDQERELRCMWRTSSCVDGGIRS
ncbi:hypothetical protein ACE103_09450 [Bradyrhizobium sp. ma5]|uniref:hypothetical protein n=1 Tax=Bradyrhizobium sp. ma5 TaxID=3344828 RepID=UPI0035D442BF